MSISIVKNGVSLSKKNESTANQLGNQIFAEFSNARKTQKEYTIELYLHILSYPLLSEEIALCAEVRELFADVAKDNGYDVTKGLPPCLGVTKEDGYLAVKPLDLEHTKTLTFQIQARKNNSLKMTFSIQQKNKTI